MGCLLEIFIRLLLALLYLGTVSSCKGNLSHLILSLNLNHLIRVDKLICFSRFFKYKKGIEMKKEIDISRVGEFLKDGMTISLGGFFGCGAPHHIIDEIVKTGVKDLVLVSSDTYIDGEGAGKLVSSNQISKLIASHIGTNKYTQKRVNEGFIELELIPQGTFIEKFRAATAGLGGVLTPTGLGTLAQEGRRVINVDGKDYILEKPIQVDLAIIKAYKSDEIGNLIYNKSARNFNVVMAGAAKMTIAEVEEIVEVGELDPNFIHTPFVYVDYIVKA